MFLTMIVKYFSNRLKVNEKIFVTAQELLVYTHKIDLAFNYRIQREHIAT